MAVRSRAELGTRTVRREIGPTSATLCGQVKEDPWLGLSRRAWFLDPDNAMVAVLAEA